MLCVQHKKKVCARKNNTRSTRPSLCMADIAACVSFHPAYITPAEEASLLASLSTPAGWTDVAGRQLRSVGGRVDTTGALLPAPLPGWAGRLCERLAGDNSVWPHADPPNHILVNRYAPAAGILPHEDGPAYAPTACILSLGGWAVLRFWAKPAGGGPVDVAAPPTASLAAPPRSLIVFSGDAYTSCLHGIDATDAEIIDASIVNVRAAGLWLDGAACGVCGRDDRPQVEDSTTTTRLCACGLPATRTVPRSEARVSLTVRRVLRVRKGLALRL